MRPEQITSALITGSSSGIGRAIAIELARRVPADLVLTARRTEHLARLKEEIETLWGEEVKARRRIVVIPGDIATSNGRQLVLDTLAAEGIALDLLVNNAGFGSLGQFDTLPLERESEMVQLNCIAPLELCRALIPQMKARGRGAIVNVASLCAFTPMPYMATYGATKAFLLSFTAALNAELSGTGVTLLTLAPGPTESEFHLAAGLTEKINVLHSMSAEKVAKECVDGLFAGKSLVVNGVGNYLLANLARLLGPRLAASTVRVMLRRYRHSGGGA